MFSSALLKLLLRLLQLPRPRFNRNLFAPPSIRYAHFIIISKPAWSLQLPSANLLFHILHLNRESKDPMAQTTGCKSAHCGAPANLINFSFGPDVLETNQLGIMFTGLLEERRSGPHLLSGLSKSVS